jgi:prepilin-type N-terminal cleavage/methylation domain-containing protein
MSKSFRNNGFSLTEVLMAAGILAIGFAFIAGMFPVGVRLTALATEQTIAPIVTDEAIAKVKLYGDPNLLQVMSLTEYRDFSDIARWRWFVIPPDEFTYPSADISPEPKKYHWSALCGLLPGDNVHITIFVSRKAGAGARYYTHESQYTSIPANYGQAVLDPDEDDWPVPVKVGVTPSVNPDQERLLTIESGYETFINTGCTIVDNQFDVVKGTWQIYRVLGRGMNDDPENVIRLDRNWEGLVLPDTAFVWVVPPAEGSGRNPCVGVYQTVIGF